MESRPQTRNREELTRYFVKRPIFVSKRETAFLLGVSLRSIDNFIASKELPCRRLGRRTLIPYSAIVAFSRRDH